MTVIVAKTQKEIIDNFLIRGEVFIKGQNIDWEIEFDGLDEDCVLFVCYYNNIPVGAARLHKNKVGRVATLEKYRGLGIGKEIMLGVEKYAKDNEMKELVLHAQMSVFDFYKKLGYQPLGDVFFEADIEHIKMIKEI